MVTLGREAFQENEHSLAKKMIHNRPLARIHRESPIFQALRNPALLDGKCGACDKQISGGSCARSYALTGNALGEEPYCSYIPKAFVPPPLGVKKTVSLHVLQGA